MQQERRRRGRAGEQLHLDLLRHGGVRRGAGRPRSREGVLHEPRPRVGSYHVVHVTMRLRDGLPSLRCAELHGVVRGVLASFQEHRGLWIIEYSVQDEHLHLLGESEGAEAFETGMRSLTIRTARGLNRELGLRGPLFPDRYHMEVIDTPRQMRFGYAYVLNNKRKHSNPLVPFKPLWVDPFSSAPFFDGWSVPPRIPDMARALGPSPVAEPRTWLARTGWRKHGLIHPEEVPGPRPRPNERSR